LKITVIVKFTLYIVYTLYTLKAVEVGKLALVF